MKTFLFLLVIMTYHCRGQNIEQHIEILTQPVTIQDDDWAYHGTENLILLPENRNNKNSRSIGLHFFKFPAKEKSNLAPVFFLAAGPGEPYAVDVFDNGKRAEAWRFELSFVNRNRDVILINQRGNSNAPGLPLSNFRYKWSNGGSLDQPFDMTVMNKNRRDAYANFIKKYTDNGVDLRGYDILHFIDDIEAVRRFYDYEKIALIGNSFGSQWALGYIQRYQERVDRALLSGVEPLDNNYDDPDGIWKVLELINSYAMVDTLLAKSLPANGLIAALTTIIKRLESKPAITTITRNGEEIKVTVGPDDLRFHLMYPGSRSYIDEIESWPKYIMEMYNGDFRMLADASIGRIYNSSSLMIDPLVNNSLGISKEREEMLNSRASVEWLGNINAEYTSTRDICPSPKVNEIFKRPKQYAVPMIIIHGDMDMSTPYENATSLINHFENGHLLTVKRGFHNAKRVIILQEPELADLIFSFMNIDFSTQGFTEFQHKLPDTHELPSFNFWPIGGNSLYEKEMN